MTDPMETTMTDQPRPVCPHGCRPTKQMRWVEDQWYCPKCGAEWADETVTASESDVRLMPMTREYRDWCRRMETSLEGLSGAGGTLGNIADAYDAAPADPYEAAMRAWDNSAYPHTIIAAVLAALGFPASSRETHHE